MKKSKQIKLSPIQEHAIQIADEDEIVTSKKADPEAKQEAISQQDIIKTVKVIEKDQTVAAIVNTIIGDKTFMQECKTRFNAIMADGKINYQDIPNIILIIMLLVQKYQSGTVKLTKTNTSQVISLLFVRLLTEFKITIPQSEQALMNTMIENSLTIILFSFNDVKKTCSKWCASCMKNKNSIIEGTIEKIESLSNDAQKLRSDTNALVQSISEPAEPATQESIVYPEPIPEPVKGKNKEQKSVKTKKNGKNKEQKPAETVSVPEAISEPAKPETPVQEPAKPVTPTPHTPSYVRSNTMVLPVGLNFDNIQLSIE